MRPSEVLAAWGPAAGLAPEIAPFPKVDAATLPAALVQARFLMAPMAGVSDGAYRIMARAGGAALAYTEMVSVAGIHYGGEKTWDLVVPLDAEPDVAVQLFGSKPEQFRKAARAVALRLKERLALIDINMACPVPKVTRKGEGSALLDEPGKAAEIVRQARAGLADAGSTVPVTCKIRRGRRDGEPDQAPEVARALEQAGAAAIAVHGRTAEQLYRGRADWSAISRVVQAVSVPIIASGDIIGPQAAASALAETGAAAVMVARGTYGDPWIFSDARAIQQGEEPASHGPLQRLAALECHVRLLDAAGGHMARARSLCGWYLKGMPDAAKWRDRAMRCVSLEDYLALIGGVRAMLEERDEGEARP